MVDDMERLGKKSNAMRHVQIKIVFTLAIIDGKEPNE